MKKTSFLLGVLAVLLIQGTSYAQDPDAVCAANQRDAQRLLPLTGQTLSDSEELYIYNLVKPCADAGDAAALCNLAILYKDGIYVAQDFGRAFALFSQAAEAGDQKAQYALGYFYMKGLGPVAQDYQKAVAYFQDSFDPMARHWLAYCTYFGYGTDTDKAEAVRMLEFNLIGNSGELFDQLFDEIEPTTGVPPTQFTFPPESIRKPFSYQKVKDELQNSNAPGQGRIPEEGTYEGHLVEYDWSGTRTRRYTRFILTIKDFTRFYSATLTINGKSFGSRAFTKKGGWGFDDLSFTLPNLYTDDSHLSELTYTLSELNFVDSHNLSSSSDHSLSHVAAPELHIRELNEPGTPIIMLFGKYQEEEPDSPSQRISKIRVAPNPIVGTTFTISYTLSQPTPVSIGAVPISGGSRSPLSDVYQDQGKHTQTLDATRLQPNEVYLLDIDTFDGAPQRIRVIRGE